MLYEITNGGESTPMLDFKKGVQSRWLFGELSRFIRFSNKVDVVKDIFTPTSNYDILSLRDLGPIVVSTLFPIRNSSDEEPRIENFNFMDQEFDYKTRLLD